MLNLEFTTKFAKDLKLMKARGYDKEPLWSVVDKLLKEEKLEQKYKDYQLVNSRNYKNMRECHIEPDWLFVYYKTNDRITLVLSRTGTHSDLF